jgi:hypothetical protein
MVSRIYKGINRQTFRHKMGGKCKYDFQRPRLPARRGQLQKVPGEGAGPDEHHPGRKGLKFILTVSKTKYLSVLFPKTAKILRNARPFMHFFCYLHFPVLWIRILIDLH